MMTKSLFIIFILLIIPITIYAQNDKIIVDCTDVEYIEIRKTSPGGQVLNNPECEYDCFYISYNLTKDGADKLTYDANNTNKNVERGLYINDHLLYPIPPTPEEFMNVVIPYTKQLFFPTMYSTCEETIKVAKSICPDAPVRINPEALPQSSD